MIKVIVGYKVKDINLIQPVLIQIRAEAMKHEGFVRSEILLSQSDVSLVAVEKNWDSIKDWQAWEKSAERQALLQLAKTYLIEEPRVKVYTVMPTGFQWVG